MSDDVADGIVPINVWDEEWGTSTRWVEDLAMGAGLVDVITPKPRPTYTLRKSQPTVNEGESVVISLTTTDVPLGTLIPYVITSVAAADIDVPVAGDLVVDENGEASITIGFAEDLTTEGDEVLLFTLAGILPPTTMSLTIIDTSLTPPPPATYTLNTDVSSVDEGGTVAATLVTTQVPNGTLIPYTISGVAAADITVPLTGNFSVDSQGLASLAIGVAADATTEGAETLTITLGGITPVVSKSVTINDTSTTPVPTVEKRFFTTFMRSVHSHLSLASGITMQSNFDIQVKVRTTWRYHETIMGDNHKSNYYFNVSGGIIQVFLNNTSYDYPDSNVTVNGNLHTLKFSQRGTAMTVYLNGNSLGTQTVSPFAGVNYFRIAGANSISTEFQGIIADVEIFQNGVLAHSWKLDGAPGVTSEPDTVGGNHATRQNVPLGDVEEFSWIGGKWRNADQSVVFGEIGKI